ncbi:MAG: hypothetical protein M1833_006524 [Piccolia ochrophora]|nr:MAG: hypothetical protein M1833_006524 [Piccolia ochrophora]
MPLESQFSLSVELTKLVPLGPVIDSAGRGILQLARNLRKSGSDITVEEDLAAVFGRNRIDPRFDSTFRTAVKESTVHQLGALLDVVLEAGAGPTVLRSLRDRAYFSTVVQLSLLTWAYDIYPLATQLARALERRLEKAPLDQKDYPGYNALLGSLMACREQTAGFQWHLIFQAVERSLETDASFKDIRTPRSHIDHGELSEALQVDVLQGCLDMLTSVQTLSEDRFLHIRTSRGFKTLIVWAHHVLGLTVCLQPSGSDDTVTFGDGDVNVFVVVCPEPEASVCLLDGGSQEVFRISPSHDDPILTAEQRVPAFGFGCHFIRRWHDMAPSADVAADGGARQTMQSIVSHCAWSLEVNPRLGHRVSPSLLRNTAMFIFGNPALEFETTPGYTRGGFSGEAALSRVLLAYTQIENLEKCKELPLTPQLDLGIASDSFQVISRLLLGCALEEYLHILQRASLISWCGWSLYVGTFGLPNPTQVSAGGMFVVPGVPSRGGERKRFIVDGPSTSSPVGFRASVPPSSITSRPVVHYNAYVRDAKLRLLVGTFKDSFEVTVRILTTGEGGDQDVRRWDTGLRTMQDVCALLHVLGECEHAPPEPGNSVQLPESCSLYDPRHVKDTKYPAEVDWVFTLLAPGNTAKQWLALYDVHCAVSFEQSDFTNNVVLRDGKCCIDCAASTARRLIAERQVQLNTGRDPGSTSGPRYAVLVL